MRLFKLIKKRKFLFVIVMITFFLFLGIISILLPLNSKSLLILRIVLFPSEAEISSYKDSYENDVSSKELDMDINLNEIHTAIDFEMENLIDEDYLNNYEYTLTGKDGDIKEEYYQFNIKWLGLSIKRNFLKTRTILDPFSEKTVTGSKDITIVKGNLELKFQEIITLLKAETASQLEEYFYEDVKFEISNKQRLENIEIKEINFVDNINEDKEGKLIAGKLILTLNNCKREISENLIYDPMEKIWKFENSKDLIDRLCIPQFIQQGDRFIGTCIDCTYYPANKMYGMKPEYTPAVKQLDLQTDVYINTKAYNDLRNLYSDARTAGHSILINSAYRSYETQQNTFETWVQTEMNAGKNRAAAEAIANTYSARPGFSEHQLGTAVDIVTTQCNTFGHGCGPNEAIWQWLLDNAYKYGFAISYPRNRESLTGYVFEPWHYRWIGQELASEFKQVESTTTLQEFLFNKNLY